MIGERVAVVALLLVACTSESRQPHKDAGEPVHHCATHREPPPNATFVRATWITRLLDQRDRVGLARITVRSTYAVTDGWPTALSSCLDIENVPKNIAVLARQFDAHDMGLEQPKAHVRIVLAVEVLAPARVVDGTRLNHPAAHLRWVFEGRPNAFTGHFDEVLSHRTFIGGHGATIGIDTITTALEMSQQPLQP